MIQIVCPNNNIPERTYAINVLFNELLGCGISGGDILFDDNVSNYSIVLNGKSIIIEDHFFLKHPDPLSYLNEQSLPGALEFFHGMGLEIPIIYGRDLFEEDDSYITIGLDIFASTFFMLTRWEESLLGREERGDCDENQLFVSKYGIYHRPIVHEYEELLRLLLSMCGMQFKERRYNVVMSHDVDGFLTPSCFEIIKSFIRQLIYGKPRNRILNLTWFEKIRYKMAFPTSYSQFEFYTDVCKKYDLPEWFYFKVCDYGEVECTYKYNSTQTREIVKRLKRKSKPLMLLGFHPSQSTFGNSSQWNSELDRVNDLIGLTPEIGRNHHLLYNYEMLRMWEKAANKTPKGDLIISNCVFHNKFGYRSGIAVPYYLFDIFERRTMNLREHPCQIMDTVIRYHRKSKTENEIWEEIKPVIDSAKKYNCELVLTWHIYIRNAKLIREYFKWCEDIVQYAK